MASTPIALVTADWHIKNHDKAWLNIPLYKDQEYALEQIVDYCASYEVPLFLLGDIFHSTSPKPYAINLLYQTLTRILGPCGKIYYLHGQHDPPPEYTIPRMFSSSEGENIIPISGKYFKVKNIDFVGLDFVRYNPHASDPESRGEIDYGSLLRKRSHVLLTHQCWVELFDFYESGRCYEEEVSQYTDLTISGDFHRYEERKINNSRLVSPGCVYPVGIGDIWKKFVLLLHDDLSIKALPLKERSIFRLQLPSASDNAIEEFVDFRDSVVNEINTDLEPLFIVQMDSMDPELVKILKKAAGSDAYVHIIVSTESRESIREANKEKGECSMVAALSHFLDDKEELEIASKIWLSDNWTDEISNAKELLCPQIQGDKEE